MNKSPKKAMMNIKCLLLLSLTFSLSQAFYTELINQALSYYNLPPADFPPTFEEQLTETIRVLSNLPQVRVSCTSDDWTWSDEPFFNDFTRQHHSFDENHWPWEHENNPPFELQQNYNLPSPNEFFVLIDDFSSGAQLSSHIINYDACRATLEDTVYTLNYYFLFQQSVDLNESEPLNKTEQLDNFTMTLGNTSSMIIECSNMTESQIINATSYISQFETFNDYLIAFLTNLSGNAFNFFIFFNDIQVASTTCSLNLVYYTIGKFVLAIFDVQPVPELPPILREQNPLSSQNKTLVEQAGAFYRDFYRPFKEGNMEELYQNAFDHGFEKFTEVGDNLFQHLKRYLREKERKAHEIKEDVGHLLPENFKLVSTEQMFQENFSRREKHKYGSDIVNVLFQTFYLHNHEHSSVKVQQTTVDTLWGYYNLSVGFLNGTNLLDQHNAQLCHTVVEEYLIIALNQFPVHIQNSSAYVVFDWINDIARMIEMLYPLEFHCRVGAGEMGAFIKLYTSGYFNLLMFLDTLAYNFGLMYDGVITFLESFEMENYFMAGYSLGSILYMVFFVA